MYYLLSLFHTQSQVKEGYSEHGNKDKNGMLECLRNARERKTGPSDERNEKECMYVCKYFQAHHQAR